MIEIDEGRLGHRRTLPEPTDSRRALWRERHTCEAIGDAAYAIAAIAVIAVRSAGLR